jgi:hypothetical protein
MKKTQALMTALLFTLPLSLNAKLVITLEDDGSGGTLATVSGGEYDGHTGPAGARISGLYHAGVQATQLEMDMAAFKAFNSVGGAWLQHPAGQINTTIAGIRAIERGKVEGIGVLQVLAGGAPR